jgi:hypothetical protein
VNAGLKRKVVCMIALTSMAYLPAAQTQDPSRGMSHGSAALSYGSGLLVAGTISALGAAGSLVVTAINAVGEASVVVLRDASTGVEYSVQMSGKALNEASVAVGTVLTVTAISVGVGLYAAGKLVAFVPNEVGRSLLHQTRVN